jgi:hypothetical protein
MCTNVGGHAIGAPTNIIDSQEFDFMTKTWRIANLVVLGLLILISFLGTFYKHISFGMGLGDIFGYAGLYLTTLIHFILTIASRKKGATRHLILAIVFFVVTIWICLGATLWRGSEYPWNGRVFYLPCPTEVTVKDGDLEKRLLITMCSMEYNSELKAMWDGQFMKMVGGELKIPSDLREYIDYPIDIIDIKPESENQIVGELVAKPRFITDTLKIGNTYNLEGEIIGIINSRPLVEVRINN